MTQASLFGDIPNDFQVTAHSDVSDDDENLDEKIRQRLEDNLGEVSFDFDDSDNFSDNDSRSSSVNHNQNNNSGVGFLSNHETSQEAMKKAGAQMNGSYCSRNSSFTNRGMNLNMLPNSVMDSSDNLVYPMSMNGNVHSPDFGTVLRGQAKLNGNFINGNGTSLSTTKPNKQVTFVENYQKNRDQEELEESNPTISQIHQQHCPRTENGDHLSKDILATMNNKDEQLQALLETRQRQLERSEEEVLKLQKDKRSLSHQVGLMKTEMNHMRSQQDEALKLLKLREKDCEYLRTKLQEAIEEYQHVQAQSISARDKAAELESEVGRLKDEINLLKSIGSSTHQAEVSDIVRQLREKHASEIVSLKKVVSGLEGRILTYQRQQELLVEDGFKQKTMLSNACSQTDEHHVDDFHKKVERTKLSLVKDEENGEYLIQEHKKTIVSLHERLQEIEKRFEDEKTQMEETYQKEIDLYRHKLAVLPGELYKQWEDKQAELGIQAYRDSRPICVDAYTVIDEDDYHFSNNGSQHLTSHIENRVGPDCQDAGAQVNFASVLANHEINGSPTDGRPLAAGNVQINEKETSSVIIQTDETLETYKILGTLLTTWSNEVQTAKANEEECMLKCRKYEEDINKLRKDFKMLHKIATKCRKESKLKEENLTKEINRMKARYMEVLQQLDQKLDILA